MDLTRTPLDAAQASALADCYTDLSYGRIKAFLGLCERFGDEMGNEIALRALALREQARREGWARPERAA